VSLAKLLRKAELCDEAEIKMPQILVES